MKNYDELWKEVKAIDDNISRRLLCYLMGYCQSNKHFLKGVEAGLVTYMVTGKKEVQ